MMTNLLPRYKRELRTVMDEATTLIWTLDPAQFPYREDSPLRSEPFQIGNEYHEFRIVTKAKYFYFSSTLTSNRNHSIRCELMTTTGKSLGCVFHKLNNVTPRTNLFIMDPGQLCQHIGENEMVKLVTTFFPERPFPSSLRSWTSEGGASIKKCERFVRLNRNIRDGELNVKTHPGVTVFWSTYPPFFWESAPFHLEQDSFQLWTRQDAAGEVFVGVRRLSCESKSALTSFQLTVRRIYNNELVLDTVIHKFDFHLNESYEGCCMGSSQFNQLQNYSNLRISYSLFREDEDCLENARRKGLHSLSRNLKELFETGQDSDITIEVDKEKFFGHRAILSARCPFFASMLKHDMIEKNTGVIKIPHYTAVELKEFLLYLYTGRVGWFTTEKALSLYRVANEYLVPELKAECLEFLGTDLSVDTFCDITALSLKYGEKELSQLARRFFKENSHAVVKSESWKMYKDETYDGPNLEAECLEFLKNVELPNSTTFSSPQYEGVLQVVVNEATIVVWTLNPGQFLHREARPHKSELFEVGEMSCEFRIYRAFEHLYFTLVRNNNRSHSTSVQCALVTETGDILDSVLHELYYITTSTNLFVIEQEELRRSIDDSITMKLVATFFPKRFLSCHRSAPPEEGAGIGEWESCPRMEQDCRGIGLKTKTHPGVNAFWKADLGRAFWMGKYFLNHPFSSESKPFDLGEDSFQLLIREDDMGEVFVGVRSVRLTTRSLTSFRLTVWTIQNELLMSHFLQKFDFHMNESYEGHCISSNESIKLLESNKYLRISCSLFQVDNDCLEYAKRQGLNSLSRDLKELLLPGEASDLTIEVDKEKFFGHRAILSARCPFFANMLKHDMVEKNTGVVKIPHYTADEFNDFLLYLYTGRVELLTTEKALSLYTAAEEYDVPDLKADCLEFMKWNLSVDTLVDVISVALMHDEEELLRIAKQFFNANFLAVTKTANWKMFEKENFDEANKMCITAFEAAIPKLKI